MKTPPKSVNAHSRHTFLWCSWPSARGDIALFFSHFALIVWLGRSRTDEILAKEGHSPVSGQAHGMTADQVIKALNMLPHPIEGGFYAETYRSSASLAQNVLPSPAGSPYPADRSLATAIYYLLTPGTFSAMHRVRGDEMFHFYLGDPVETLQLDPNGSGEIIILGQDIACGMKLQHNVPGGVWQGSLLRQGGRFALMGTTMSPGFDYADYETGHRDALIAQYPLFRDHIAARTTPSNGAPSHL